MGYRISTTINDMLAESCEHSLKTRTNYLPTDKYAIKLLSNEDDLLSNKMCKLFLDARKMNKLDQINNTFLLFKSYHLTSYHKNKRINKFNHPLPYPYELSVIIEQLDDIINIDTGRQINDAPNSNEKNLFRKWTKW